MTFSQSTSNKLVNFPFPCLCIVNYIIIHVYHMTFSQSTSNKLVNFPFLCLHIGNYITIIISHDIQTITCSYTLY